MELHLYGVILRTVEVGRGMIVDPATACAVCKDTLQDSVTRDWKCRFEHAQQRQTEARRGLSNYWRGSRPDTITEKRLAATTSQTLASLANRAESTILRRKK